MRRLLIATSNAGKLRDFAAAAAPHGIEVASLPGFHLLPPIAEDAPTFEGNARKKAEHYSRFAPGGLVVADDSGLEVAALNGAPGVLSARYAAVAGGNASDSANNQRLLCELADVPDEQRGARFVCVIAAARDGQTLATARGEARGVILRLPRGAGGFGYDPLFYFWPLHKTFAELTTEEKAQVSHRGHAFRAFLDWLLGQELGAKG
jgi:XTP/dITP diphosphohydrolase